MTVKAEFNPSTALMHFTDATGRVQVVEDIPTPTENYIKLSGIRRCSDDTLWTTMNTFHIVSASMKCVNRDVFSFFDVDGVTHRVTFRDPGSGLAQLIIREEATFDDVFLSILFTPCVNKNLSAPVRNTWVSGNCVSPGIISYDGDIIWDFTLQ